jgi:hypothetical protein
MTAVSAPTLYVNNTQNFIVGSSGIQQVVSLSSLNNQDLQNLMLFMPTPGSAASGFGARRLVVNSAQIETTFTNTSTSPLELIVYQISLKKDLPDTWTYNQGTAVYGFSPSPDDYWSEGLNVAGNNIAGSVTSMQTPGSIPTDSQFFNDYFKIDKRTTVLLQQGGAHRQMLNFNPNTMIKEDEIGQTSFARPCVALKRMNRWVMAVCTGLPCVNAAITPTNTTLASAGLAIVQTRRYRYHFVLDATSGGFWNNSIPQNVAAVDQRIVNIGTGTYVAPAGNIV